MKKVTKQLSEGMNDKSYNELVEDLTKLNFDIYPGCRIDAVKHANEIGISTDEILAKLSDETILRAIDASAQVMGLYSDLDDEGVNENVKEQKLKKLFCESVKKRNQELYGFKPKTDEE